MTKKLEEKVAAITGRNTGIGLEAAKLVAGRMGNVAEMAA